MDAVGMYRAADTACDYCDEGLVKMSEEIMAPGFYNMDCMDALPTFPNKFFDLAIVDPPYGIKVARHKCGEIIWGGGAAIRRQPFMDRRKAESRA